MGNEHTSELNDYNSNKSLILKEDYQVHDYLWYDNGGKLVITVDTELANILKGLIRVNPDAVCMASGLFYIINSKSNEYDTIANINIRPCRMLTSVKYDLGSYFANIILSSLARSYIHRYSSSKDTHIYIIFNDIDNATAYQYAEPTMFQRPFTLKINVLWEPSENKTNIIFTPK